MQKTRLPLVMLLGLAALALLSGCAGAAPTPAEAMREAGEQVAQELAAQSVELTATPTPTPTPEPTATPTPTPTPTPEATPTPDAEAIARELQQWYQAHIGEEYSFYQRFWPKYSESNQKITDYWYKANPVRSQEEYMPRMIQMLLGVFGDKMDYPLAEKVMALMQADPENTLLWFGSKVWYAEGKQKNLYSLQPLVYFQLDERGNLQVFAANESASQFLDFRPAIGTYFAGFFKDYRAAPYTTSSWIVVQHNANVNFALTIFSEPPSGNANLGRFNLKVIETEEIPEWIYDIMSDSTAKR